MEIELSDENAKITFPEKIKIIKEVTDDEAYKNASLALTKPLGPESGFGRRIFRYPSSKYS